MKRHIVIGLLFACLVALVATPAWAKPSATRAPVSKFRMVSVAATATTPTPPPVTDMNVWIEGINTLKVSWINPTVPFASTFVGWTADGYWIGSTGMTWLCYATNGKALNSFETTVVPLGGRYLVVVYANYYEDPYSSGPTTATVIVPAPVIFGSTFATTGSLNRSYPFAVTAQVPNDPATNNTPSMTSWAAEGTATYTLQQRYSTSTAWKTVRTVNGSWSYGYPSVGSYSFNPGSSTPGRGWWQITATVNLKPQFYVAGESTGTQSWSVTKLMHITVPVALSITSNHTSVSRYHSVTFSGIISPNMANGTHVVVYAKKPGSSSWTKLSTRSTYSSHHWSYSYKPNKKGTWYFQVRYTGDGDYLSKTSSSRKVSVN